MTQKFRHSFNWLGRLHESICDVLLYSDDGENFICFREIGIGTSVTNASEQIAQEIVEKFNFNPTDCRFFETYDDESYDEIEYTWINIRNKWEARQPDWRRAGPEITELFNS